MNAFLRRPVAVSILTGLILQGPAIVCGGDVVMGPGAAGAAASPLRRVPPSPFPPRPVPKVAVLDGGYGISNDAVSGAHASYLDGPFDLSKTSSLRFVFPLSAVGDNFFVRVAPKGTVYDSPVWVSLHKFTVPPSGVIDISLTYFTQGPLFPNTKLTIDQLKQIAQISVHSGSNAWNFPLGQSAVKKADFTTISSIAAPVTRRTRVSPNPGVIRAQAVKSPTNRSVIFVGPKSPAESYIPALLLEALDRWPSSSDPVDINDPALQSHDVQILQ